MTGKTVAQYVLNSEAEVIGPESIHLVGANAGAPIIAWTDGSVKSLKVNVLGSKQISSLDIDREDNETIEKVVVHAPHLIQSRSHFLVHFQTAKSHWASVYHIDLTSSKISKAYDLPRLPGAGTFSTSSRDANVFFTRNTLDEVIVVSSASHGILGRWPSKFPDTILHGVSEVVARQGNTYAVRSAVVNSAGDWSLIRNGELSWTRYEDLASIVAAEWAEIKEKEDLARELVKSLNAEQGKIAIIATNAPPDIITSNARKAKSLEPLGISAAKLLPPQKELLMKLLQEYVLRYRNEIAELELKKIRAAGDEKIHFAWAGGLAPGQGHYYRIQGPTFLMEYDNTQNNANHIHTVWRDFENDFGEDLLRKHYEQVPHPK